MEKLHRSSGSGETGSTLIEVLVATMILMTGVMGMAQLLVMSTVSNTAARTDTVATVLAQQKLEQLRGLAYGFDTAGLPVSDVDTDTTVYPEATRWHGAAAFSDNIVAGEHRRLRRPCRWTRPARWQRRRRSSRAVYTRRWSIEPLPTNPNNTLVIQVLVTPQSRSRGRRRGNVVRLAGEARVMTVKTRKAQ